MSITMPAQPFDVAGLRDALPAAPVQRAQIGGAAGAAWAADFLARQPATPQTHTPSQAHAQGQTQGHAQVQALSGARVEQQDRVQSASVCLCCRSVLSLTCSFSLICLRRVFFGGSSQAVQFRGGRCMRVMGWLRWPA